MVRDEEELFLSGQRVFKLYIRWIEAEGRKRSLGRRLRSKTTSLLEAAHKAAVRAILVLAIHRGTSMTHCSDHLKQTNNRNYADIWL